MFQLLPVRVNLIADCNVEALNFVLTIDRVVVSTLYALTVAIFLNKVDKYVF